MLHGAVEPINMLEQLDVEASRIESSAAGTSTSSKYFPAAIQSAGGPQTPPPVISPDQGPVLLRRLPSIMGGVKKRMSSLTEVEDLVGASVISSSSLSTSSITAAKETHANAVSNASTWYAAETQPWFCLRVIVTGAIALTALIACGSMFILSEVFAVRISELVDSEDADSQHLMLQHDMQHLLRLQRTWGFAVCALVVAGCGTLGWILGNAVCRPLLEVCHVVDQLCELGVTGKADVVASLRAGAVSRIDEALRVQRAFSRLLLSMETFARHLPETIVQRIVRGDERANRLHVSRRTATIMFSDIANFTQISESLEQEDVLLLLTRYFSIMTRIVELNGGVVAEILGDGLLAYWNAPDQVDDHPTRACAAALAQQQVLTALNEEFAQLMLPALRLRIGIHTGTVLAGNIGSETKMKWGCIGDAVNLASRLESLCKFYEVGILCSGETRRALPEGTGIFCRELDLVQVKGKKKPTEIHEVLGLLDDAECDACETRAYVSKGGKRCKPFTTRSVSGTAKEAMQESTRALQKFDIFHPLRAATRRLTGGSISSTNTSPRTPRSKVYEMSTPPSVPREASSRKIGRGPPSRETSPYQQNISVVTNSTQAKETSPHRCRFASASASNGDSSAQDSPLRSCKSSAIGSSWGLHPVDPDTCIRAERYEQALRAYKAARFQEAHDLAQTLLEGQVPDRPAALLVERAAQHLDTFFAEEELAAWTGVRVMHDK